MDTPEMIAALPEMEPSASVRAVAAYWVFHNGERVLPTDQRHPIIAVPKISQAIGRACHDGQSSALAALQPLIEAAQEIHRLGLVIESAVRYADPNYQPEVLAALKTIQATLSSFPAAPGGMWRPIDDEARRAADEEWVWTCVAGTKFPYLATYEDADWWTLNQCYESAFTHDDPRRLYKPTHWMPFCALPAPPSPTSTTDDGAAHG